MHEEYGTVMHENIFKVFCYKSLGQSYCEILDRLISRPFRYVHIERALEKYQSEHKAGCLVCQELKQNTRCFRGESSELL
jgi:hypothetical protein